MAKLKTPKYDNDLVNLGYLKELLDLQKKANEAKILSIPKNYGSPPKPPYYVNETWTNGKKLYKCIKSRLSGSFTLSDWILIVDGDALPNFISDIYSIDKINIQNQIDNKIESYTQEADPSTSWTTDLEKEKHKGDMWRNPITEGYEEKIWTKFNTNPITYGWVETSVPQVVWDAIDGKKTIYTSKPSSYSINDLWVIESTITLEDLPPGALIGDWVVSLQDSLSYNKNHWIKRDNNVNIEYLETNYYEKTFIDEKVELIESNVDSKITQAKNEIDLAVESDYTTKTETIEVINRVDDVENSIGDINTTITNQNNTIAQLSIEDGAIRNLVSEQNIKSTEIETNLNNNYLTEEQINAITAATNQNIEEINTRQTQQEQTAQDFEYRITSINTNGVSKLVNTVLVIDENGLNLSKTGEQMTGFFGYFQHDGETKMGLQVKRNSEEVLGADNSGVRAENLNVRKYLVIAETGRFEKYYDGIGFFYIGDGGVD